ncbi:class I SAM-dependent methyltransferase [Catalinimonas niigatensis]|uniref:class I SAM-dependent methyltransferase n=1 Tax=Catalinimonas niigatensis TaxID=1397264 RepID=UPI002666FD00|nr:class I SAM-dependent methyltransferase [Catalinimonas niigatensis]WPP49711.1 class I SAM-dependent methyltransferase [Catalinimonas niigatensis]
MNQEFWNKRYQEEKTLYGLEPNRFFAEKIKQLRVGRLLLPGEGEGRNAVYAAYLGWTVIAFDMSEIARENALLWAKQKREHLHYHLATAQSFPYPTHYYDAVALMFFHLPLELRKMVHQKIAKSLKPGGKLILTGFGKEQLNFESGGPKDAEMLYDIDTLKKEFDRIHWLEAYDRIEALKEGKGHQGPGHVISLYGELEE